MKFNLVAVSLLSTCCHAIAQEVVDQGQGECTNPNAASGTCDTNANASLSASLPQEQEQEKNASYSDLSHLTDGNDNCKFWAEVGECDVNPGYVHVDALFSCQMCSCSCSCSCGWSLKVARAFPTLL